MPRELVSCRPIHTAKVVDRVFNCIPAQYAVLNHQDGMWEVLTGVAMPRSGFGIGRTFRRSSGSGPSLRDLLGSLLFLEGFRLFF